MHPLSLSPSPIVLCGGAVVAIFIPYSRCFGYGVEAVEIRVNPKTLKGKVRCRNLIF
jgi:hypothetical protein